MTYYGGEELEDYENTDRNTATAICFLLDVIHDETTSRNAKRDPDDWLRLQPNILEEMIVPTSQWKAKPQVYELQVRYIGMTLLIVNCFNQGHY